MISQSHIHHHIQKLIDTMNKATQGFGYEMQNIRIT